MITEANLQNAIKCLNKNITLNFKRVIGEGQLESMNKLTPYFKIEVIHYLNPLDIHFSSITNKELDQEMLALYQRATLQNEMVLIPKNNKIYILDPH